MSSRITRKHPSIILTLLTAILASASFFQRILLSNLACISVLFRPKSTEDVGCKENREADGADEMTAKLPDADTLLEAQRAGRPKCSSDGHAACHYALSSTRHGSTFGTAWTCGSVS
jgi:hypothetical protein